jgi:hypothetical protein
MTLLFISYGFETLFSSGETVADKRWRWRIQEGLFTGYVKGKILYKQKG